MAKKLTAVQAFEKALAHDADFKTHMTNNNYSAMVHSKRQCDKYFALACELEKAE